MGTKYVILTIILGFLIIDHVTNAEFSWNFRRLADSSPKEDPNVPPIPTPVVAIDKNNGTSPPSTPEEKNPKEEQVKNPTPPSKPPTDSNKHDDGPKEDVKEHNVDTSKDNGKDSKSPEEEVKEKGKEEKKPTESCDGMERICQDEKSMAACIKSIDDVSKAVVLLIQNKGKNSLKVDLAVPSFGNKQEVTEIPKPQTKLVNIPFAKVEGNMVRKVNIPLAKVVGNEIKLSSGNGYCVLHLDLGAPIFQGNFYQWYPSYSKFMTPMYGAYLVLFITLVAVGVCACCWFSKRKRTNEVPYQELEMSVPESAAGVGTTEGWDEVWDDDWDEEKAVKSPGHSISGNGLTSRTTKKDGWEDWDD